jgi:preprotein translocase subunit SecA
MYKKLSGMTGTAVTEAEEFAKIYSLDTTVIPTHKPMVRDDKNDLIYRTETGKYQAVINEVKERQKKGQPILIGTISIEKNQMLSSMMERAGLKPAILNAKNHDKEARIIADAGNPGAITIATNMAGRGVDIMLGGLEPKKDTPEHESWQKNRAKVLELGGLHVIGTERHEARRIDNQLRGRAGRQGDSGSSQFFVSMDDDLMRIFGGDRMKAVMTTLKVPEDMPIENKLISRSIESAQTKVEGNNFDIRKHLVEYDDVLSKHREAIYKKRRLILELASDQEKKEALSDLILENVENEIEQVVSFHTASDNISDWNLTEIYQVMSTMFPVENALESDLSEYTKDDTHKLDKAKARTAIIEHLFSMAKEKYTSIKEKAKEAELNWRDIERAVLIRSIDTLWVEHLEAASSVRQGIGLRGYGQRDPLVEYKKEAYRLFNELNSLIQKEVVYTVFKVGAIQTQAASTFEAPGLMERARQFSAPAKTMSGNAGSFAQYKQAASRPSATEQASTGGETKDKITPKAKDASGKKVGRNDPCPCGSGKKYKKCHGK